MPREHLSSVHEGEGLLRCEVVHQTGRMLTVDVPGVPLDGPGTADIRLDAWLEGLVRIRAAAGRAAIIGPTPARALAAPSPAHVAVLVASKNGSCSIADTVRSAVGQADLYVVSDGSDDDTVAVAAAAGATVLALETTRVRTNGVEADNDT